MALVSEAPQLEFLACISLASVLLPVFSLLLLPAKVSCYQIQRLANTGLCSMVWLQHRARICTAMDRMLFTCYYCR